MWGRMLATVVGRVAWPMILLLPIWLLIGSGLLGDGSEGYEVILLILAAPFLIAAGIVTAILALRLRGAETTAATAFAGLTIAWWAAIVLLPLVISEVGDGVVNPSFAQRVGLSGSANDWALRLLAWGAIALAIASWVALGMARSEVKRQRLAEEPVRQP